MWFQIIYLSPCLKIYFLLILFLGVFKVCISLYHFIINKHDYTLWVSINLNNYISLNLCCICNNRSTLFTHFFSNTDQVVGSLEISFIQWGFFKQELCSLGSIKFCDKTFIYWKGVVLQINSSLPLFYH